MPEERSRILGVTERVRSFKEVSLGLTRGQAIENARIYLEREGSVKGEGCPLGTDYFAVLRHISKGDLVSALLKVLEKNPLPGVTGRLCPEAYPETQIYNKRSERISLRAIERFLADNVRQGKGQINGHAAARQKQKVAIAGSGPTGLSAAAYLLRQGYRVTIFDSSHIAGGTLTFAYPEFRLPEKAATCEVQRATEGALLQCNSLLGRNVLPEELFEEQGYSALLLACGGSTSKPLGVPHEEAAGIIAVEELLRNRHWMKAGESRHSTPLGVGRNVVVVGKGERAFDAARILVRLGRKVTMVIRGSESHMDVDALTVRLAAEEGVKFKTFASPLEVTEDSFGMVKTLVCQVLDYKVDKEGQLSIVADKDAVFSLEADTVIVADQFEANSEFLKHVPGLMFDPAGIVLRKPASSQTTAAKIFAAGHLIDPSMTLMAAILSGQKAAQEIDRFLNG